MALRFLGVVNLAIGCGSGCAVLGRLGGEVEFYSSWLALLSWNREIVVLVVRVNRSVRNQPACFRCPFERVGKSPIEAGVIVIENMS